MTDVDALFRAAAARAAAFRTALPDRPVGAARTAEELHEVFGGPLPEIPSTPGDVIDRLADAAADGLTGNAGPRFFGFVVGGALPAATAADIMAAGWDQFSFNAITSPAAAAAENAAGTWLKELLSIPQTASVGFATGAQGANTVGLAAARHHVLAQAGWDVGLHGLAGAPRVQVLAGAERHGTIDRSLRLLGLGTASVAAGTGRGERRDRPGGAREAARLNGSRPADRVPAGRQREHRGLRRPAHHHRVGPRSRWLGARRRRLRAVGRGRTLDPSPG